MPNNTNQPSESELIEMINNIGQDLGIYKDGINNFNGFNVYKNLEGQDFLSSNISYAFFTKPCLHFGDDIDDSLRNINIYKNLNRENFFRTCPFIDDIVNRKSRQYADILNSLKGGFGFVPMLTNLMENFENQDTSTETKSVSETFKGYKLTTPTSNIESLTGGNFTLNFTETRNLEVTVYHKIINDYIDGVRRGAIIPAKSAIRRYNKNNQKNNGYIDYMNSIYYFLLDRDGKTIKYYAKYTGVFPTSVSYSSFNWNLGEGEGLKKVSVNYHYNYKEDLNPEILKEFNYVAGLQNRCYIPYIEPGNLRSYTIKQNVTKNFWKKKVRVAYSEVGDEVHDYLLFE